VVGVLTTLVRDRFTWLAYGHLSVFAYFFYGFGPVVPLLLREQHTTRAVAALHSTAFAVGGVVCGTLAPWAVRRCGRQVTTWTALGGMSAGVLGFAVAHALWATLSLAMFASACGTLVVTIAMAALSEHHGAAGPAALTEGNSVAAGIGLLAPLVVGATVAAGWGWRPGLAVVAGLAALLGVGALALRARIPGARPPPPATTVGRLPRRYRLAWCLLLCTASVEVCLNLWVADVMRTHSHASVGAATASLSAVVGGMCLGRLAGSRLLLRRPAPRVLLGALAVSAAGFAVFWLAPVAWLAVAGLILLGLGDSVHFPLAIALVVANSGGQPDLAVSRSTYAAALAFGVSPFVLGLVADRTGPHIAFLLVPVFLAGAAALAWRLRRPAEPAAELDAPAAVPAG
jgi:predicted MFS family arabinose efflux permease